MSIRVGTYDFFAYTLPGGIYLIATLYLLQKYGGFLFDYTNIPTVYFIVLIGAAYIMGLVIDPIASNFWYWLFRPKDFFKTTMKEFNQRNSRIQVEFQDMDWYVLVAYIKRINREMATDIEHINALHIMFRNLSFGFLIYSAIATLEYIERAYSIPFAVMAGLLLIGSIIFIRQAIRFNRWFYQGIYQSIAALALEVHQLPINMAITRSQNVSESEPKRQSMRRK